MKQVRLGTSDISVAAIGLGCMGMSEFYGATNDQVSVLVLQRALELGVTMFDTADTYGAGHNETMVGAALKERGGAPVIATKFGIARKPGEYARRIDNSAAYIRQACEDSLRRLGTDTIDLYYAHRISADVPIEESVGVMADLVRSGKVRALGLCEVSADLLRRAHAVHPIAAVQSEYSVWSREPEIDLLPACRALGVSFVAYSPLGRGMSTGNIDTKTVFDDNDFRKIAPRFQPEHLAANLALLSALKALAVEKHCTPAQISLAWLLAQGNDIVAIPGTKQIGYLESNWQASHIALDAADLTRINQALPLGAASGARYPEAGRQGLETRKAAA
ncbi:MAG: aldo/keto reductase [Burkholderiaceae bacterium]|nr:aldo/keto reductase [Burkholderiaceae bacterium]